MTNLANKITLVRIFLVPVAAFFLLANIEHGQVIATVVFAIAASTDKLDGYIARKHNQVTTLGKLLDPLADKLLVSAALISLVATGDLPAWIAIVIVSREFAVTGLRSVAAAEGHVIPASRWGKLKTVSQIVSLVALMANKYLALELLYMPINVLLYFSVIVTVVSGIDYFVKADRILAISKEF